MLSHANFLFHCPMLNLHDRINYIVSKIKCPQCFLWRTALYIVTIQLLDIYWVVPDLLRVTYGPVTCTLGSCFASEGHPADSLWVVASRGQL